jgi:hypothetical protein
MGVDRAEFFLDLACSGESRTGVAGVIRRKRDHAPFLRQHAADPVLRFRFAVLGFGRPTLGQEIDVHMLAGPCRALGA